MQTYTPALDAMGSPQMEPVGNGGWIRAEDHAAALATAREVTVQPIPPGKWCKCGLPHETGGPCWECRALKGGE